LLSVEKAKNMFPNRSLEIHKWVDLQGRCSCCMKDLGLYIRVQAEKNGEDVPEEISEAYWKIWNYLPNPSFCFIDV